MPTISLCMIVKNEEKNLPRLLKSVHGLYDQICIVDTGSSDKTAEIAAGFGAEVFFFTPQTHPEYFAEDGRLIDFSAARNFSYSKATCDYQSWLDADDVLLPDDLQKALALKPRLSADAYRCMYIYSRDQHGRPIALLPRHRFVRRGVAHWRWPIHECMQFRHGFTERTCDVQVTHLRDAIDVKADLGRNLPILKAAIEKDPSDQRMRYYYAKELGESGEHDQSVEQFSEYFKNPDWNHNQLNGRMNMANSLIKLQRHKEAVDCCLKGLVIDATRAEFYSIIGTSYYLQKKWQDARRWFEMAARLPLPTDSECTTLNDHYTWVPQFHLVVCYNNLGMISRAAEANEKALKYLPTHASLLNNREIFRNHLFPGRSARGPIRLSLGSGGKFTPTYRNCDLHPCPGVDEVFDQCSIPYLDRSVHAIYSEHALEHVGHQAAEAAISEWARVLRYGGHLDLKVPDLEACCAMFLSQKDREALPGESWSPREWFRYTIYGIQKSLNTEPESAQYHHTGFWKYQLRALLEKNGFTIKKLESYDGFRTPSIHIEAAHLKKSPRVAWMIPGSVDRSHASLRIRILNVHNWMTANGIDSRLIENFYGRKSDDLINELRLADAVVFVSSGQLELDLTLKLRRHRVTVVYDHCEDIECPGQRKCFGAASVITCCSTMLAHRSMHYNRCYVIPDAYECDPLAIPNYDNNGKLRVIWIGYGGNAMNADALRPIVESLGMELQIVSEWDRPDHTKFELSNWLRTMASADIVVCPQRHWLQPAKSNNKATQAMSLGMPVCASPIQSYKEVIRHGENGYICANPEEWRECLEKLKDAQLRRKIGEAAKTSVAGYSIQRIGELWSNLLAEIAVENCEPERCDIIIPTWRNLPYLQACIESIRKNTDWPYNIIVVNSGNDETNEWLAKMPDVIRVNLPQRAHFSAAINAGLHVSKAKFVCLLNDDTIVTQNWLAPLMREAMKPRVGAVNPFSNCDKGWLHNETHVVGGVDLHPNMTLDEVRHIIPQIYNYEHAYEVTDREWVAFFATVLPRQAIDDVGGVLDEDFKSGCEDRVFCARLKKAGWKMKTAFDSFVFHFGGKTRKRSEDQNHGQHHAEDRQNNALMQKKLQAILGAPGKPGAAGAPSPARIPDIPASAGTRNNRVAIYTGAAWERWSPKSLNDGGIGGSETATVFTAREFAKRGYDVTVYGDCADREGNYDGVQYLDHSRWNPADPVDIFISSRRADVFARKINARKKICIVHDIWISPDRNANLNANNVDYFFVLSPWHKNFFMNHHRGFRESQIFVTRDGIDLARFVSALPRVRGRLVYSSSPDRGLDVLLDSLPKIRAKVPEAHLRVFYGFENWEKAVARRNNRSEIAWMNRIKQQLKQPGVEYFGRVGQDRLAQEFLQAELWAYPTVFTETFAITACEAMAAGVPVICSDLAALHTTVGDAGILIPGDSRSEAYQQRFVDACVAVLSSRQIWEHMSARSLAKAQRYRWDTLIDEWMEVLK